MATSRFTEWLRTPWRQAIRVTLWLISCLIFHEPLFAKRFRVITKHPFRITIFRILSITYFLRNIEHFSCYFDSRNFETKYTVCSISRNKRNFVFRDIIVLTELESLYFGQESWLYWRKSPCSRRPRIEPWRRSWRPTISASRPTLSRPSPRRTRTHTLP